MGFVASKFLCPKCGEKVPIFRMTNSSPMFPYKCSCGVKVVEGTHWFVRFLITNITFVPSLVVFGAVLFYYLDNFLSSTSSLTVGSLSIAFGLVLASLSMVCVYYFVCFISILIFGLGYKEIK